MKENLFFAFSLIGKIGFATAIPLVAFGLLGRYLDQIFGTSPYLVLIGFVLATVIVFFSVRKITKEAIERLNRKS